MVAVLEGLSYDPLAVKVYDQIKTAILDTRIRPGEQVRIKDVADRFGVSVTPVRDALRRLEMDGLVDIAPRRGAFVRRVTAEQVVETFQIRRIVECAAIHEVARAPEAALATMRQLLTEMERLRTGNSFGSYRRYIDLDAAFHRTIVDLAENSRLTEFYQGLRWAVHPTLVLARAGDQRAAQTMAEHEAILEALEANNRSAARSRIRRHLANAERDLLDHLAVRDRPLALDGADGDGQPRSGAGSTRLPPGST